MLPLSRPTLLLWAAATLPYVLLALAPGRLPYSEAHLMGRCYTVLAIIVGIAQLVSLFRLPRVAPRNQVRIHFGLPLVTVAIFPFLYGAWVGISAYDRLWYFVETASMLLWVLPLTWHLGVKLEVYRPEVSHRGFISHLIIKCIAILETSIAAGFYTHGVLVGTPTELLGSLLTLNLVIQIPLLLPLIAFAVRLGRPLKHYFGEEWTRSLLAVSFRRAQLYPYLLITLAFIFMLMAVTLFVLTGHLTFGLSLQPLLLLTGLVILFVLGGQLYAFLSLRRELASALQRMSRSGILDHSKVRSPVSLRFKLGIWFGLLVFIATAFSAYWSYVQYGKLVSDFLGNKATKQLETFEKTLWERSSRFSEADLIASVNRMVKEYSEYDDGVYYHYPSRGKVFAKSKGQRTIPRFHVRLRSRMRMEQGGPLQLPEQGLFGAFRAISHNGKRVGVVALLYRQENPFHAAGVGRAGRLFFFFLMLFLIGTGGVVYFVAEFTRPLKRLEGNVAAITSGRFGELVRPEGEADEIGRLSFTLESMRRTIHEKISTIEKLNLNLESMVSERTDDLSLANEELKKALSELEEAQQQLVVTGRLAALGKLLAGIAHEINNPVNAITNSLAPLSEVIEVLEQKGADAETIADARAMVRVVSRGTERIKQVVERITSTLRPRETPVAPVDLREVLENSLSLVAHRLKGIEVSTQFKGESVVMAHKGPLGQVFENLMVNAAGAMEECSERRLAISVIGADGVVTVCFHDTGTGMSEEILEHIFDPFFTTKEVGKGMGLGLSIVHDIVSRYHGTMEVTSQEGEGTRMIIRLPAV